jgi:N-methylhydantoinase B
MGNLGGSMTFYGVDPESGRPYVLQTIEGGGWGARPYEDGVSTCVSVCQGDVRNSPIETIELKSPVIVERRALREDSGGPGKFRGGLGIMTQMTNLREGKWSLSNAGRRQCPPWGIAGGGNGRASLNYMRNPGESELKPFDPIRKDSAPGSSVMVATAGGGGWGDPLERPAEKVHLDVLEELVTLQSAREFYGVVIDTATRKLDLAGTQALRQQMRASEKGGEARA